MQSLFLEGLQSARLIVKEKGLDALDDLIKELDATQSRENAMAEHPSMEKR